MQVAILAGGRGLRLAELTGDIPKPMVEIGGQPILRHIMRHFLAAGFDDFAIALGYRSDVIRRFFVESQLVTGHLTIDGRRGQVATTQQVAEPWRVQLVETGADTNTGGRIKRLAPHLDGQTFLLTWGDGLADVDLHRLVEFHHSHGRLATVTAVHPPSRFGRLQLTGDAVTRFDEKPREDVWINGAFFVLEPSVIEYIDGDDTSWEHGPLRRLADEGQLQAYRHEGFWQCMDTLHDRDLLQALWNRGDAPWQTWQNHEIKSQHNADISGRENHARPVDGQPGIHRLPAVRNAG